MCFSKGSLTTASRTALIKVQACDEYKNLLPVEHIYNFGLKNNNTRTNEQKILVTIIPVFTGNKFLHTDGNIGLSGYNTCIDNILYITVYHIQQAFGIL